MKSALKTILDPGGARSWSIGLLVMRVSVAVVLAPHGVAKMADGTARFAQGLAAKGFPVPSLMAWMAALSELFGSAFLALGLFTRPAAAAVSATMVVAWVSSHLAQAALIGKNGGAAFEYPFLLSLVAAGFVVAGGGRYSVDRLLAGK